MTPPESPDLVVLSHLRWTWVWQRPQHLVSRFATMRAASGARTWFVEEPVATDVTEPTLGIEHTDGVTRVWLEVPVVEGAPELLSFDAIGAESYPGLLSDLLLQEGRPSSPDLLMYTPMALDLATALAPGRLWYDVMDDLASFKNAPKGLQFLQKELLAEADLVFAGGRSLHQSVLRHRTRDCYLFASGVDVDHYAASRPLREARSPHDRKVAGYVGVIDERLNLELIAGLADALPDWTIRIVGPVAKIDPASLPQASNLEYPGMASYDQLPAIMAAFDVALMPFALNEATRSISPTKTLEYLAAGLPVVSTRVPDVVADYTGVVHLAEGAAEFAGACQTVVEHSREDRDRRVRPIQARQSWDAIAGAMATLMHETPGKGGERRERARNIEDAAASDSAAFSADLELAHTYAAGAAVAGMQDAALGSLRLSGAGVPTLADAAVSSATPYLRAPLLARLSAALVLHPPAGDEDGNCATCRTPAPCETAMALKW